MQIEYQVLGQSVSNTRLSVTCGEDCSEIWILPRG